MWQKNKCKGVVMKKLFISQPMKDRTQEEIMTERKELIQKAKEKYGEEIEILDSYFANFNGNALAFLGKSLEVLSKAAVALFGKGWENARGCKMEHLACKEYGIETIEL
jgi:hypothetical protein